LGAKGGGQSRLARVHRGIKESVDAAVEHVLHDSLLHHGVALGLADEQQVPVVERRRNAPPDDLAGEGLAGDGV
jgi:hypothetical protein